MAKKEYTTQQAAEAAALVEFGKYKAAMVAKGYTVKNGGIVGKNSVTGEDQPDKQLTTSWDIPRQKEIGKFELEEYI